MYCTENLEAAQSAGQRATPAASWQPKAAQASRQREGRVVDVSAEGAPVVLICAQRYKEYLENRQVR